MRLKELRDLTVSGFVLALAFGIALSGGYSAFRNPAQLLRVFLISIIAVSAGFILHEIGHRFVARRYGCFAEYTMWPVGLVVALALSFFGLILAAPGAVMIRPGVDQWGRAALTKEKTGKISLTGPAMNLLLAIVFLILNIAHPTLLFMLGARINTWLAIFNLIPFGPLDGYKIFHWDKRAWGAAVAVGGCLYLIGRFIF
jgi:Zn-dependent protease